MFALDLLGRHVHGCPNHRSRSGMPLASDNLGDAEVHQDGLPHDIDHQIGWFNIAVDHPALVGVVHCIANVSNILDGLGDGYFSPTCVEPFKMVLDRFSGHKLQHHIIVIIIAVEVIDLDDVGVAQLCYGCSLFLEALDEVRIAGEMRVDHLDGHHPLQIGVLGLVHR